MSGREMETKIPIFCTMNTFSPEMHPAKIIDAISAIGYAGSDLCCDGLFYPYSESTLAEIAQALERSNTVLANANSMTTGYFWRQLGLPPEKIPGNGFKGPDISDSKNEYAEFGVSDSVQWRLDRIESCMRLAALLKIPRLNTNVGSGIRVWRAEIWPRVLRALDEIRNMAKRYGVQVCIETEPSLFISGRPEIERVFREFPDDCFLWGFDVGHQIKYYRGNHEAVIRDMREMSQRLGYFHVEDISRTDWEGEMLRHVHLPIGEGDIRFAPIFDVLKEIQMARVQSGMAMLPVYYENYNSFDLDEFGSARRSLRELRVLTKNQNSREIL